MKRLLLTAAIISLASQAGAYDKNTVVFGLGLSDVMEANKEPVGNIEWRGASWDKLGTMGVGGFSPMAGISLDTEGAGMVYAGILNDWNFYDAWSLVPSFGAGAHWDGDGKDMGGTFQFRAAVEVNYKLDENSRAGVSLAHISSFGINDTDPGKEDLTFNYQIGF